MITSKQVLRECPVFAALSDGELEKVASLVSEKQYEAGTTLFQEGDSAEELMVIEEGRVAVQMTLLKTPGQISRRVTIDVVSKSEVLGWSAVVEPYLYTLTAVCLQKVRALSINGAKLRQLLQDNCGIGCKVLNGLIRVVASRLDDTRQVLISERLVAG